MQPLLMLAFDMTGLQYGRLTSNGHDDLNCYKNDRNESKGSSNEACNIKQLTAPYLKIGRWFSLDGHGVFLAQRIRSNGSGPEGWHNNGANLLTSDA